nr:ribonuclease PH [Alphaproteobacteria bacterium]
MTASRPSGRDSGQLRTIDIICDVSKHAEGSCLIKFGDTHVLCTATVEEHVPGWMKNSGKGWVTAEYGMLPRATDKRTDREAARGKQTGRTQEIQRLIGRALRAIVDFEKMGERQVRLDCDVIQADGGTRTAAITGSYVALYKAFEYLVTLGLLKEMPLKDSISAISVGIYQGQAALDLDYAEDSNAETDANFVITGKG